MKHTLMLTVILMGLSANAEPKQHVLQVSDLDSTVTLAQDEVLVVELPAQLSTGYSWGVTTDQGVLNFTHRSSVTAPNLGGMDLEQLYFKGVSAGEANITFLLNRSWDLVTESNEHHSLKVVVSGPYVGSWAPDTKSLMMEVSLDQGLGVGVVAKLNWCDPGDGTNKRCTPIRNQGNCGSCWAFATAGVVEQLLQFDSSDDIDLSEQYLVSCNTHGYSCNGGWTAFDLYTDTFRSPPETEAGVVYESDFKYTGTNNTCGSKPHPHYDQLDSWHQLSGTPTTADIKEAINTFGPVFVTVDANGFSGYKSGIFRGSRRTGANHAVVLVGWNDNGGDGYWILRNSWGTNWGEKGYMRIAYGADRVGGYAWTAELPTPPTPPHTGCSSTTGNGTLVAFALMAMAGILMGIPSRRGSRRFP